MYILLIRYFDFEFKRNSVIINDLVLYLNNLRETSIVKYGYKE